MLSYRRIGATLAAVLMLAGTCIGPTDVAAAEVEIGTSCSGSQNAADWDTIAQCSSGTFVRACYALCSAAASAGSSCSGYSAGTIRYNTTLANLEYCDGTTWQQVPAYSTSCGSPSGLSFTDVTNASLNTVYTSNTATITFSGCSAALSVSVSGAATAQISVNGGAWATSGAILSGQTLQVRLTSSGSVSTGLTATVTVGSSSTNWTVTTRSGSLKAFTTPSSYTPGSLGGLSGADTICQTAANTAGYSGTYKAIMSDDSTSAASRLTLSYPIVNAYDGSTVAASNLWAGSLDGPIKNPSGSTGFELETGTTSAGAIVTGRTCSSWTSTSGNFEYGISSNYTTDSWIAQKNDANCPVNANIYCIQQ